MKKRIFAKKFFTVLQIGVVFFAVATMARADEAKVNTFTVTPQVSYITYKEKDVGVKETGVFYGLLGSYIYRGAIFSEADSTMLKAEGRLSFGRVNYDGQLSNGTPYEIDGINDVLFELRGLLGYDFDIIDSTKITPFAGLGYRFLSDNLSKDPAGYRRFANYFYSPFGFETRTAITDDWDAGVSLEYDLFWFGRQYSYLSDFNSTYGDVTNDQNKGYGFRGSVKFSKKSDPMNISIEPYFVYWSIDKSKDANLVLSGSVVGTAYEPKNTSSEFGAMVGFEF